MAVKVFFLLALIIVIVKADSDCNCDPKGESEEKDLWNFLGKYSEEFDDPEEEELRAVLPGVLSPLLECNCLEKYRRKRKIMPEVEEATEKQINEEPENIDDFVRQKKSIHYKTPRCPQNYAWIGIMCVPEEYLD